MKTIDIYCENTGQEKSYPLGTSLFEIAEDLKDQLRMKVCGAYVNNKVRELSFEIVKPKNIRFFGLNETDGMRIYIRSLFFLFYVAFKKVCPGARLIIDHAISNGYYCEIEDLKCDNHAGMVRQIKEEMTLMVTKDLPIVRNGIKMSELLEAYEKQGLHDKVMLFSKTGWLYGYAYFLDGYINYFHGHMLPSTYYLQTFDVEPFDNGLLLRLPDDKDFGRLQDFVPEHKLFGIFREHQQWAELIGIDHIGKLNQAVDQGRVGEIIKISEALHEKKIAEIATAIAGNPNKIRLVLIAGPSSSGKTTFSKRLAIQLAVCGKTPRTLSVDNYFVDREHTPRDENGHYDFEALEAIDIDFFNQQLVDLFEGRRVDLPKFDFTTGQRSFNGHTLQLGPNDILIVEGIHALNPDLIPRVDHSLTYRIFISALTSLSIDDHNPIPTTDNRLIRRIIRDAKYRGYPALETLHRWRSVRRGEEKNIFPHQEKADVMFNSALLYELGVLKKYAEPLLKSVPEDQPEYAEALRLLKFLNYFRSMEDHEIPPTSLIREFLGGSSFSYKD
ncbi:MAG TPA: nucleoside kinase [Prolixibacteraceae bacterium]|nr:nucleoside kinase [Prolixibacteraceae bacterium]